MQEFFNAITETLSMWAEVILRHLPDVLLAIVIIVISVMVARMARRGARKFMARIHESESLQHLAAVVTHVFVILVGLAIALSVLDLGKAVTSLLAGAGIVGIAIGFAFQDLIANFIAGFMLAINKPLEVGDFIETNDFLGTVVEIDLRTTTIYTPQGERVMIPNKDILQNPLRNYTSVIKRRIDITCGVSYNDDLARAQEVAIQAIEALDGLDENEEVDCIFTEFGDSAINFKVRLWIPVEGKYDYLTMQSRAIMALKTAFDQEGISIPFPIRTIISEK